MDDLECAPLLTEFLVVDAAPGWKRVELTPTEVQAVVEAGADLPGRIRVDALGQVIVQGSTPS